MPDPLDPVDFLKEFLSQYRTRITTLKRGFRGRPYGYGRSDDLKDEAAASEEGQVGHEDIP